MTMQDTLSPAPTTLSSFVGHSRPKDGVRSLAYDRANRFSKNSIRKVVIHRSFA
jgi:hypothetical protein